MTSGRRLAATIALAVVAASCRGSGGTPYGSPAAHPRFEDVSASAGFTLAQGERASGDDCLFNADRIVAAFPKLVPPASSRDVARECDAQNSAGGAAAVDVDGDGLDDIVMTRMKGSPLLYLNESTPGHVKFRDATAGSGLHTLAAATNGVAAADIDNDGDQDLFIPVLAGPQAYLLVNDGRGRFTEEAAARGTAMVNGLPHSGTSATFADYDNDGWIDLHTDEWQTADVYPYGIESHSRLFRNLGAAGKPGVFTDVTVAAGVDIESRIDNVFSFSSMLTDIDGDGHPDLYVASDFGTSRFFWNNGDGTFTESTHAAGAGDEENGMGLAVGFFDSDEHPSVFVTSIMATDECDDLSQLSRTGNRLYTYAGNRKLEEITDRAGVRNAGWGWGTTTIDARNTGLSDLVAAAGMSISWDATRECYRDDPVRYWQATSPGVFTQQAEIAGLAVPGPTKAVVAFDADNDGRTDLFVTRDTATPLLLRNVTPKVGHWIGIRAVGARSNRDAVGAIVTVIPAEGERPVKGIIGQGGRFLSRDSLVLHLGTGKRRTLSSVSVYFPATKLTSEMHDVQADRVITFTEPGT